MKMSFSNEVGWCPICGGLMEPSESEVVGDYINANYACDDCEIDVTYAAPNDHRAWEEYADGEIYLEIEPFAS